MTDNASWQPKIIGLQEKWQPTSPSPMTIPSCDPTNTITQVDLDKAIAQQGVAKIKYIFTEQGAYLMFELRKHPGREFYLTTRRDRTRPRTFVDQHQLLQELHQKFPGLI